ncbi:MAG: DUF739 domain-containing protein [Oscillospiraceae bacterium]|nr:DUF739 domain-containing protein [Oscillospiraceae bacterium]
MIDVNELKACIVRKGLTQADVAKKLDISTKTFYDRMKKGVFGSDEIEKMIFFLDIKDPMTIFFASKVT